MMEEKRKRVGALFDTTELLNLHRVCHSKAYVIDEGSVVPRIGIKAIKQAGKVKERTVFF
jgi:hypothetical protein